MIHNPSTDDMLVLLKMVENLVKTLLEKKLLFQLIFTEMGWSESHTVYRLSTPYANVH